MIRRAELGKNPFVNDYVRALFRFHFHFHLENEFVTLEFQTNKQTNNDRQGSSIEFDLINSIHISQLFRSGIEEELIHPLFAWS